MIIMTRRWLLALVAAVAMVAASMVSLGAAPTKVTFLHTNDVYEISPSGGQGGLAELMTLLRKERAAADHAITTFGGDLISPSVMSGLTKGAQMIDVFNAIGVDVAVPGNHEFDFGPEVAAKRMGESKFPWLAANVSGAAGMTDVLTIKAGDFTIGFFGLIAPETDVLSSPGTGIKFADVFETAEAAVKKLKAAGADVIVALTHLDIAVDRELAGVRGINLILGGHDHDPITFYEGGVLIHKSGYDAHYLGAIDVSLEWYEKRGKKRLRVRPAWRMISTAGVAPDAEVKAIVDGHNAKLDAELGMVIGKTTVQLDSRRASVRTGETNFGSLIADAMMQEVGADVGLTNGGGIRGDKTYDAGTELTRKDILTELPFGNVTVKLAVSGADLLAALENGFSKVEDKAGRFPQVAGMTVVYDPKAAKGSRVVSVKVGGASLDKGKTYTVATNDYMGGGGDGYKALKKGKMLIDASAATLMATTVMNYVTAKGTVAPKIEGRVTAK
ncbi:MAG: bifunctional metallophosphatase/5'-nucleotidase [Rhodospirillales bacterium]|jgi:5'-nucleotidase / UDP-sugar diphosphatase|nr:bifunctional metallophosphatase/5'-nucleotidase [Rhodospirillales bacterium]